MRAHTKRYFGWLAAVGLALSLPASSRAEGVDQIGSLKWIPANASFYTSSLRMKEQLDIALKSKAWAKFKSLPAVQQGLQMLQMQMQANPQSAGVLQMLEQPENKQLLGLLGAMFSDEVFLYGDASWGPLLKGLAESNSAMQFGGLQAALAAGNQPGQVD